MKKKTRIGAQGLGAVLLCGLLACSGDDSGQPDAATDGSMDANVDVADAGPPLPPVPAVQYLDGSVLTTPNIIPIVFSTYNKTSDVNTFLTTLAGSSYWTQVTKEYTTAPLTAQSAVVLGETPPTMIDDSQIRGWLSGEIQGDAGLPPPTLNNLYVVFYPSTTTITYNLAGWMLCVNNLGYHESMPGTPPIVYAVIPDCGPVPTRTSNALDSVTSIASHEIVEAVTDPLQTSLGWVTVDAPHTVWDFDPGTEVGDLCAFQPQSYQRIVGAYVVQRSWSNASAAAGHDPCVPLLQQPYFNSIPLLTDMVPINGILGHVTTTGVKVPMTTSATVPVQLYADGTTTSWHVTAQNEPPSSTDLSFSWDTTNGNAGDVLQLTITRMKVDTTGRGGSEFRVTSQGSGVNSGQQGMWWGFVGQ